MIHAISPSSLSGIGGRDRHPFATGAHRDETVVGWGGGGGRSRQTGLGQAERRHGGLFARWGVSHGLAGCIRLRSTPPRQPAAKLGEEAVLWEAQFPAFCTTLRECLACKVDLVEGRTSSKEAVLGAMARIRCVGASNHATQVVDYFMWLCRGFCVMIYINFAVVRYTLMMKHSLYMWL